MPDYPLITEAGLKLSDVVTNDVSITKHGLAPKAPNDSSKYLNGQGAYTVPPTGSGNFGQATIPFASWKSEDKVSVVGQAAILATAKILVSLYADTDDVYAQEWHPPVVRNIVAGTGFDIEIRPDIGTFKGNVKVNWTWSS